MQRNDKGGLPPSVREVDFAKQKTEGVSCRMGDTTPVICLGSANDSPLREGAGGYGLHPKGTSARFALGRHVAALIAMTNKMGNNS